MSLGGEERSQNRSRDCNCEGGLGVGDAALAKNERELNRFEAFMANRSRYYPTDIRLEDLIAYRADWTALYPSSQTRAMVQTRLRGFLRFSRTGRYSSSSKMRMGAFCLEHVESSPL